jgi:hypothetical protein
MANYYFFAPEEMDKDIMGTLLFLVFIILLVFILRKEHNIHLKGQYLKHSTLTILGIVIVHFQLYTDYVLGTISNRYWIIWVNHTIVVKCLILSIVGLLCFLLGYLFNKKEKRGIKAIPYESPISVQFLLWLATALLIGYFATVNPLYISGHYGAEKIGTEAAYIILFFRAVIFAIIIQNCRNMIVSKQIPRSFKEYVRMQGVHLTALISIYLATVMISGDRGPIIIYGLCYFSGYFFVTKKKLKMAFALLFISGGAVFISLLGTIRNLDKEESFVTRLEASLETDETRFDQDSFLPQTQDLATSIRTLHTTVNYIPDQHDYMYGRFQFQQIAVAIPFFSIFNPLIFEDQHYKYGGSTRFVTWINQGDFPFSGDGTTCIADFYFDFGLLGVIVGMFLFGYFIRYAEVSMYSKSLPSLFTHVLFVGYLCNAIYIARSSVLIEMKLISWIFLILIFNRYLINYNRLNENNFSDPNFETGRSRTSDFRIG